MLHTAEGNTEKMWIHRFLAKPKTIAAGGLGGAVSTPEGPRQCLVGAKLPNNFFRIKHAKTVIVSMNIG